VGRGSRAGFITVPLFLRLKAGLPSLLNSNNPRAVEPERAGQRQSGNRPIPLMRSSIVRRDNFVVLINNWVSTFALIDHNCQKGSTK
jgi:hypothetical protein